VRKFLVFIATGIALYSASVPCSYASDVWILIRSEYRAPNWYCTYQLQGSTAYKSTVVPGNFQATVCPSSISG